MCLAIPMRVISVDGNLGRVEASGALLTVALDLVEGVQPGDYLLVHAGFAIARMDADEAQENLDIIKRLTESPEP
ncbi:MAG: HypC/HybG/HupF family hydrogenase formation chaperone [Deltaproteobacteria bacterium]|nr:HypC/HybG/HupF family hydrogenase formation chaperone [Deltaproteobacteria bacterium]